MAPSPNQKLRNAILETISPPVSKETQAAMASRKRIRIQQSIGVVLTSEEALEQLHQQQAKKAKIRQQPAPVSPRKLKFKRPPIYSIRKNDRIVQVPGDGNCMFAAVAKGVFNRMDRIMANHLRKRAVRYVVDNWMQFCDVLGQVHKIKDSEQYLQLMQNHHIMADEPELVALSELLDVQLQVYKDSNGPAMCTYNANSSRVVNLRYVKQHYDLLLLDGESELPIADRHISGWAVVKVPLERQRGMKYRLYIARVSIPF